MEWITPTTLSIIGGVAVFFWPVLQFILTRQREADWREFETYHRLIKELVQPDTGMEHVKLDRQIAVVFELRHFPRYRELTIRLLRGMRASWVANSANKRLIDEIDLTLGALK